MAGFSPSLADIHALDSRSGVASLCADLLAAIRPTVSPLLVASDELNRLGWDPPPITSEWWLDMIEAQSSWDWPLTEQVPWHFPLPIGSQGGTNRGLSIAWTALQLNWQEEARQLNICQTTHPDQVLTFINENTALREACDKYPEIVANYAPQLLIPELSGRFSGAFDVLLSASSLIVQRNPDRRFPIATCERHFALRLHDFGRNPSNEVADKWVNGRGGDYSAKHHHLTDYVFWLLSEDSRWMPEAVKNFLIQGMREWCAWNIDLTHEDVWDKDLAREIYGRKRRLVHWPKLLRLKLEKTVFLSLGRLGIYEDPCPVAARFIDHDFIGTLHEFHQRRQRRAQ